MELFFRRAFSKGSASPSPCCEPFLSIGQPAGGWAEDGSDDLFGTCFRRERERESRRKHFRQPANMMMQALPAARANEDLFGAHVRPDGSKKEAKNGLKFESGGIWGSSGAQVEPEWPT